ISFKVNVLFSFLGKTLTVPEGSRIANSTSAALKISLLRKLSNKSSVVNFSFFKLSSIILPSLIKTVLFPWTKSRKRLLFKEKYSSPNGTITRQTSLKDRRQYLLFDLSY